MQRRDFLHGLLWFAGSPVLASAVSGGLSSAMGMLGIMLECDTGLIWPDSKYAADDFWCLPAGQWLAPQAYARFVRGRTGFGVFSVLDAANHCLLGEALRLYGGSIRHEKRLRLGAKQWRYLLYATV